MEYSTRRCFKKFCCVLLWCAYVKWTTVTTKMTIQSICFSYLCTFITLFFPIPVHCIHIETDAFFGFVYNYYIFHPPLFIVTRASNICVWGCLFLFAACFFSRSLRLVSFVHSIHAFSLFDIFRCVVYMYLFRQFPSFLLSPVRLARLPFTFDAFSLRIVRPASNSTLR